MLILVGRGERTCEFAHVEREHCARCEVERDFVLCMKYEYGHFYHLFGWVMSRQYQLICPECSHGWRLDPRSARALIGRDPVPFHQRAGGLVLVLLIVVIAVAAVSAHLRDAATSTPTPTTPDRPSVLAALSPASLRFAARLLSLPARQIHVRRLPGAPAMPHEGAAAGPRVVILRSEGGVGRFLARFGRRGGPSIHSRRR